jgi:hypothetical protein
MAEMDLGEYLTIGIFIVLLDIVYLAMVPTINVAAATAVANSTGAAATVYALVPLMFAFIIICVNVVAVVIVVQKIRGHP